MLSQQYAPTAGKQGFQKSLRLGTNDFWHSKNECNRLKTHGTLALALGHNEC